MRRALLLLALTGCGRIGFDEPSVDVAGDYAPSVYVKPQVPQDTARFGAAIVFSADGTVMAVRSANERSNATGVDGDQTDTSLINAGAVFVFERDGAAWRQTAYLKSDATAENQLFGNGLALSSDGTVLAVGAPGDSRLVDGGGAAYLFERTGSTWQQTQALIASVPSVGAQFGSSVAIDAVARTVAVSVPAENAGLGAVYLFERDGTGFTERQILRAANGAPGDEFGNAIATSGDARTIVVAANHRASPTGEPDAGAGYVFTRRGATWMQTASLESPAGGAFGTSVAIAPAGSTLAFGASNTTIGGLQSAGVVHIFVRAGDAWRAEQTLQAPAPQSDAHLGFSTALTEHGDVLVAGSYTESPDAGALQAGAAHVYQRNDGVWREVHQLEASNPDADDFFGSGVAITPDGATLAVGSPHENSASADPSDNSLNDSGAIYVFDRR